MKKNILYLTLLFLSICLGSCSSNSSSEEKTDSESTVTQNYSREDNYAISLLDAISFKDHKRFNWIKKEEVVTLPEGSSVRSEFERDADKIEEYLTEHMKFQYKRGKEEGVNWTSYQYEKIVFEQYADKYLGGWDTAKGHIYFSSDNKNFKMQFDSVIIYPTGEWRFIDLGSIKVI